MPLVGVCAIFAASIEITSWAALFGSRKRLIFNGSHSSQAHRLVMSLIRKGRNIVNATTNIQMRENVIQRKGFSTTTDVTETKRKKSWSVFLIKWPRATLTICKIHCCFRPQAASDVASCYHLKLPDTDEIIKIQDSGGKVMGTRIVSQSKLMWLNLLKG